jgi:hypothetical protein
MRVVMRASFAVLVASAMLSATIALAGAEKIEAATLDAITAVATKGYVHPASAAVRNVRKSRAKNGLGYCGEVSVEGGGGFTLFHVILAGKDSAASVLRLADYPDSDRSRNAMAVRRLLVDFGCTEPDIAVNLRKPYEHAIPAGSFASMVLFALSQPEDVDNNEILYQPTSEEFLVWRQPICCSAGTI